MQKGFKDYMKQIGIESLFMLLATVIGCGTILLQFLGMKETGNVSGSIWTVYEYSYNLFFYIAGILIFWALTILLYTHKIKAATERLTEYNIFLRIIFCFILLILAFIMYIAFIIAAVARLGLNKNIYPELMLWFSVAGWPLFLFLYVVSDMIIAGIRKKI